MLVLVLLAGCGSNAESDAALREVQVVEAGKSAARAALKDPASAQFQNVRRSSKGAVCGNINAKNSFGAYTGFHRFIAGGRTMAVIEGDVPQNTFEETWAQVCI